LNTAHFTFNEKRINYHYNFVVVGKGIQKRIFTMITKSDDTIDSDVDQTYIMLDMKLEIDKQNDSGIVMDDEKYSLK
jgi:hypothetical protein